MRFVRKLSRTLLSLFFVVMGGAAAGGREAPSANAPALDGPWTIERALERALEANSDLLVAKSDYERQQGVRIQIRARLLPQIAVVASGDKRDPKMIDRQPSEFSRPPDQRSATALTSYDARVQLQQLIFDGLESWHQNRRYKALEEQSRFTMEAVAHQTVALTRQGFDAILWRREALAREEDRVVALSQVVEWTAKKQALGEVADYEKFRAQAELKLAEAALAQAHSDEAKAEQYFRRLLMLPDANGPLLLAGDLHPRTLAIPLAEATAMARSRRPDLSAALANVRAANYGVRAAYGGYLPRVQATGSYGSRSSYYDASRHFVGYSAGVVAQWGIFDGFENRGRVRTELAARRTANLRLEELEFQIESQLRELYAGLDLARSSMEAQRAAADLSGRSLAQARRLHELGQISLEQVLQAELTNRQAQLGVLEAVFNFNSTVAQIEYSIGGPIEPGPGSTP